MNRYGNDMNDYDMEAPPPNKSRRGENKLVNGEQWFIIMLDLLLSYIINLYSEFPF